MDEVERLYTLPPEEFIAARNALAREDPARADEIRKLRKPTVAAWLVNLLALRRPELLAELAELSAALRAAQRDLQGAQLRELSGQRRAAVSALVAEVRALAIGAKPALARGSLPMAEVEATLQAALADQEAAELVRSGRLTRSIEYAGFGEVPRPQLRLVTNEPVSAAPRGRAPDRAELQRELAAAGTAENEARAELERAAEAVANGQRALAEAADALVEAQRRHAAAEEELSRLKLAHKGADRALTVARRRVGEAEAAVESVPPEAPGGTISG